MKFPIDKNIVRLYLWVGVAYAVLGIMIDVGSGEEDLPARMLNNVWRAIYILSVNYAFYEHTLPFVLRRRRVFVRVPLVLFVLWIQLMLYAFGTYAWRWLGIQVHTYISLRTFATTMEGVSYGFPFAFFSVVIFGVARYVYSHNALKAAAQQYRIEKQRAELRYLRSQTNPHFLFNTLNNIYALAKRRSPLAAESIERLSKILRYMLDEAPRDVVAIEEEMRVIDDYVALEKLRYDAALTVRVTHDIEDRKQGIPPLLLIALVENAFKHGASETRRNPFVHIQCSVRQRRLRFVVRNSVDGDTPDPIPADRIGLGNLRSQLDLLYTDYDLTVGRNEATFTAELTINLDSYVADHVHHR